MSSTRPAEEWLPPKMTCGDFQTYIQDAPADYYQPGSRKYSEVRVLTLCWDADFTTGLALQPSIHELTKVLQSPYNYLVRHYSIPGDNSATEFVEQAFKDALSGLDKHSLLIVYYVGHGENGRQIDRLFPSSLSTNKTPAQGPSVDWSHIRSTIVNTADCSVLTLMDSDLDHSPFEAIGSNKEIIASSSFAWSGPQSFTANLVQVLTRASSSQLILTMSQLYARLATRAFTKDSNGQPLLLTTPFHQQSCDMGRMPIYLAPVNGHSQGWGPPATARIEYEPVRVVMSVSLVGADQQTLQNLNGWVTGLARIHFTATCMLPGDSAVIIFKVPLSTWVNMQGHPAVRFISFDFNPDGVGYDDPPNLPSTPYDPSTHMSLFPSTRPTLWDTPYGNTR